MAEEKLELGEILARLEKVERQNRILKLAGSLLVLLASMGFVMGQGKPNRTIEADGFVLKDAMRWKWNWGAREAAEWSVGMQLRKLLSVLALIVLVGTSWATGFSQCTVPLAGAVVKTDNYSALAADSGKLIAMNCAAPCNLLLPGTVQAPNYLLWVSNIGSARVTVTAGARKINGYGSTTIDVPHGQMVLATTDGTDYLVSDLLPAMEQAGIDVTSYGVRALNVPMGLPAITCTATAGSKTLTCTSVTGFQVGDGVNVLGAGATNTMTTPLAPTVTPTISTAGTFTGLVRAGRTDGATSYSYCIMGWDSGGGHTACSDVTTIANGQATLGQRTATISTIQLANDTVTINTTGEHGYPALCSRPCGFAYVHGTQHENQFHGRYEVLSAPTATSLTYQSQHDTRVGYSDAQYTGGTVTWYNQNHIKAQGPLTGNNIYVVYGRSGATLNYLGVMLPQIASLSQATDDTYLTFDDYGPTYGTPPNRPPYVAATSAAAATNDNLLTKITAISGTTVTLRDAAINSAASTSVLFDNTADFNDAVWASPGPGHTAVYFPYTAGANVAYVFRSRVNLPALTRIVQSGAVYFYDEVYTAGGLTWTGSMTTHTCNGGGVPSFGNECEPNANFYGPIGLHMGGGGVSLRHLNFNGGSPSQNLLMLYDDNGGWETLENVQCNTGAGQPADYSSRCIVARGSKEGAFGDFGVNATNFLVNDMNPNPYNTDETPAIYMSYSLTNDRWNRLSMQRRGMLLRPPTTGVLMEINELYSQGGMNPMLVVHDDQNATISVTLKMSHFTFDTTGHAGLVNLPGPQRANIVASISDTTSPGSTGEGNLGIGSWIDGPGIFVNGLAYKNGIGYGYIWTNDGVFATAGAVQGYPQETFNTSVKIGSPYPLFTQGTPGDAPTCVVAAGTPASPANAGFNLIYAPIYPNGGSGPVSKAGTPCTSTDGSTLRATVSIPAPIPGAVGMMWFNVNANSAQVSCIPGNVFTTTLTSCVVSWPVGSGLSTPSSGPTGMRGPMLWTNQFYLGQFMKVSPTAFSALGTPANGTFLYCNDCTVANPCAGGGTGAFAKRLNGVWVCN